MADFVVVADRAESEQTRNFGGQLTLRLRGAAEISRRANIDNQHHGQLALFGKFLYERAAEARRHIPIDRTNFVARLILAHVLKIHPPSLENTVVIAGEGGLD